MNITHNQNLQYVNFPDWYNDPRDFHEAVLQTFQEAQKIKIPKLAKIHKEKLQIGYLALSWDVLDVWFIILYLSLLLQQGYESICMISCDYESDYSYYKNTQETLLQSTFATTPLECIDASENTEAYEWGFKFDTFVCVSQIISPLKNFYILKISVEGLKKKLEADKNYQNALSDFFKKNKMAIMVIGDEEHDEKREIGGGLVFDWVSKNLKRSIKKVAFQSMIGDLYLYVG
jgi:hypothetical protein